MTIKELKELLSRFDDDLPIAYKRHSVYKALDPNDKNDIIEIVALVDMGGYLENATHRWVSPVKKFSSKLYVVLPGN